MAFEGFPRDGVQFLHDLRLNNSKAWFDEHREIYEQKLKLPMMEFVRDMEEELRAFAPRMIADPRINGSIYRINRDTRFSKVKVPYKTNIAAIFWPEGGEKHRSACFYFNVEPDVVFIGGGIYMPEAVELRQLRAYIAERCREYRKIINDKALAKAFGEVYGDSLTRPPQGIDPEHPCIEYLKMKQYLVHVERKPDAALHSRKILTETAKLFRTMTPLVKFLNKALGLSVS